MGGFRDLFALLRGWFSSAPADAVVTANYYDAVAFTSSRGDAVNFSVRADAVAFTSSRTDTANFGEEAP